jgi:hypothetical protein
MISAAKAIDDLVWAVPVFQRAGYYRDFGLTRVTFLIRFEETGISLEYVTVQLIKPRQLRYSVDCRPMVSCS